MAKKVSKKTAKKSKSVVTKKFSFLDQVLENVLEAADVDRKGNVRIKRPDMKKALENAFEAAAVRAAGGERIRFPVVGSLFRADVKAKKAGKGRNPFTGEEIMVKARPASKKPRWSFPKSMKEMFATKRYW